MKNNLNRVNIHAQDGFVSRILLLSITNSITWTAKTNPKPVLNIKSSYREYLTTDSGKVFSSSEIHYTLEWMEYEGDNFVAQLDNIIISIMEHDRIVPGQMRKLGFDRNQVKQLVALNNDLFKYFDTFTKVDKWYLTNDGIEPDRIRCIDSMLNLYEVEWEEVYYTTDPDIDQEVCQGYSDNRGDYEYVRTFVTDLNEEEHRDQHMEIMRLV